MSTAARPVGTSPRGSSTAGGQPAGRRHSRNRALRAGNWRRLGRLALFLLGTAGVAPDLVAAGMGHDWLTLTSLCLVLLVGALLALGSAASSVAVALLLATSCLGAHTEWDLVVVLVWALARLPRAGRWSFRAGMVLGTLGQLIWWMTAPVESALMGRLLPALVFETVLAAAVLALRRRVQQVDRESARRRELQGELLRTRAKERARLADELQRTLSARLAGMQELLAGRPADLAGRHRLLEGADEAARSALAELRVVLAVLTDESPRPELDAARELAPTAELGTMLEEVADQFSALGTKVVVPAGLSELPPSTRSALVKSLREVVVPLLRSTREPSRASLAIERRPTTVLLTLRLEDQVAVDSRAVEAHVTMLGGRMGRERVGQGSLLQVELPIDPGTASVARRPVRWGLLLRILLVGLIALRVLLPPHDAMVVVLLAVAVALVNRWVGGVVLAVVALWAAWLDLWGLGWLVIAVAPMVYVRDSRRVQQLVWSVITVVVLVGLLRDHAASHVVPVLAVLALAWLLALAVRADGARLEQERRLSVGLLARRQELESEVRQRLARELHDVVAHQLSVVTLQVMGHRHSEDEVELDLVLDRLRTATGTAVTELATLGRVMRTGVPETTGSPSLGLSALADELRAAGHEVELDLADDLDEMPSTVGHTLLRLAQEGATNVLRHADPGGLVWIECVRDGTGVRFRMVNPCGSSVSRLPHLSQGKGLQGLSERLVLVGGDFRAGSVGEEWEVLATLPLD